MSSRVNIYSGELRQKDYYKNQPFVKIAHFIPYVQLCSLHLNTAVPSTLGLRRDLVSLTLNSRHRIYIVKNILVLIKIRKMQYEKNAQSWGLRIREYLANETSDSETEVISVISTKNYS